VKNTFETKVANKRHRRIEMTN